MKFKPRTKIFFFQKLKDKTVGTIPKFKKKTKNFFGIYDTEIIDEQIKKNIKIFKYLIFGFLLILTLSILKEVTGDASYSFNEDGSVKSIERQEVNKNDSYDLNIKNNDTEKNVVINFYKDEEKTNKGKEKSKSFEDMVNQIITEIEESKEKSILLPTKLENGDEIYWNIPLDNSIFILIFLGILLIFLVYRNNDFLIRREKKKAISQIRKELPRLINRIVLIWKSGKTFEDAVKESIEKLEEGGKKNFFISNLKEIYKRSIDNGENIIFLINNFAVNTEVKDFIRISNIMVENQYKGSFLLDKLQMEREILWINRKKSAVEEGKKAETRLVIPMAILLIALIVVTAAPAFIQM